MTITELSMTNFENEVLNSDKPVLIDFWAAWCGPCKMLSPTVDEIAGERNDIKVCKCNVDDAPDLARKFGVMSIPTLILIKDGKEENRSVGAIPKDSILKML